MQQLLADSDKTQNRTNTTPKRNSIQNSGSIHTAVTLKPLQRYAPKQSEIDVARSYLINL